MYGFFDVEAIPVETLQSFLNAYNVTKNRHSNHYKAKPTKDNPGNTPKSIIDIVPIKTGHDIVYAPFDCIVDVTKSEACGGNTLILYSTDLNYRITLCHTEPYSDNTKESYKAGEPIAKITTKYKYRGNINVNYPHLHIALRVRVPKGSGTHSKDFIIRDGNTTKKIKLYYSLMDVPDPLKFWNTYFDGKVRYGESQKYNTVRKKQVNFGDYVIPSLISLGVVIFMINND